MSPDSFINIVYLFIHLFIYLISRTRAGGGGETLFHKFSVYELFVNAILEPICIPVKSECVVLCFIFSDSGTGVNVYVIDTGIRYSHNDFGGRAYSFWDYQGGVSIPITWSMRPEKKIQRTIPHSFLISGF